MSHDSVILVVDSEPAAASGGAFPSIRHAVAAASRLDADSRIDIKWHIRRPEDYLRVIFAIPDHDMKLIIVNHMKRTLVLHDENRTAVWVGEQQ